MILKKSRKSMAIRCDDIVTRQRWRREPHPLKTAAAFFLACVIGVLFLAAAFLLPEAVYLYLMETP